MESISISEFKAKALAIVARVAETGESVRVLKRGKPMVTVSPCSPAARLQPGLLAGTVLEEEDVITPLDPGAWESNR
jgi:prevent-host-death family protein